MTDHPDEGRVDQEQTLLSHLVELRTRLIHTIIVILLVFAGLVAFSSEIYSAIATPLISRMGENSSMIATEVASTFLVPFKLTMFLALYLSMPYVLYQIWAFVAPGLYSRERRFVFPLLFSSIILFYLGTAFAFFVIFPVLFSFFNSVAPAGVLVMTDISHYLNFVLKLFFAFGMAFEVPIATILLIRTGITTVESLTRKRPYIIIGAFAIGMLLTPPDVFSQTLLAVPIWLLFELGLYFSRYFMPATEATAEEKG
ncbi:MAG: twin arginine-targeting protein translocase TatC [Gammaproteobacteria bacterium RIFCSPLOWO2_02_FULL_56_15]|nr:MAG: twin arginine-targeting protein translocase TatC [Gammaproteobacteria bacterium RIFCSPLOWO2_02_FULL_56_15]